MAAVEAPFPTLESWSSTADRSRSQSVACDFYGSMVRSRSCFPYFMLVAFEAGSVLRATILLLSSPIAWILYHGVSEAVGIKLLIFVTFAGLRVDSIETCARAVLPRFYAADLHGETWRVFSSFGKKRFVITGGPRVMIDHFANGYLGAQEVIGTELEVTRGGRRATGLVSPPGVLLGAHKRHALKAACDGGPAPDVGIGDQEHDYGFLAYCTEGFLVSRARAENGQLAKPIVFHDGRLVKCPSPIAALLMLVWLPIGFVLAILRVAAGVFLPFNCVVYALRVLGVRVRVKGAPRAATKGQGGVLFICSHRTLMDPVFIAVALGRPVTAVTYSISRVSKLMSPIKTVALTRNREVDAVLMRALLEEGDLVICPEGTTCREPFLLRFSALFAELTNQIRPVAMKNSMSMFHGTTATGWKALDPLFFFMNPSPCYEITFLSQIPLELTCAAGKASHEVANHIQRVLGCALGFQCTNLTRRDKYRILAGTDGTDGTVGAKP